MQFHEFVTQVQQEARLSSEGEALTAIVATLTTLAERLHGNEPFHLAAQLPTEIAQIVTRVDHTEAFGVDEFFRRVSEREGADLPTSTYHARAIMHVLRQAVSPGELKHIETQLPDEYGELLHFEAQTAD